MIENDQPCTACCETFGVILSCGVECIDLPADLHLPSRKFVSKIFFPTPLTNCNILDIIVYIVVIQFRLCCYSPECAAG